MANKTAGSQTLQVRVGFAGWREWEIDVNRMLEDSQYESIVRWGDEGDSFVVLEVRSHMSDLVSTSLTGHRTRNLPKTSYRGISSIAISPALSDS